MKNIGDIICKIICDDCIEFMKLMPENSVGSIVTDPPAGISFMGKSWDTFDHNMFGKEGEEGENDLKVKKNFKILPRYDNSDLIGFQNFICQVFTEAIRVLKPGGYAFVWAIPRTSHHTMMGLERAGFEIRDVVTHIFATGFPKSHNIGKQEGCEEWEGWGTALKPAAEFWILCRKLLAEGSVAENVLKHGVGGINIDASRIGIDPEIDDPRLGGKGDWSSDKMAKNVYNGGWTGKRTGSSPDGRFPSNVIFQCTCKQTIDGKPLESTPAEESKGGIFKPSEGKPAGPTYEGGVRIHTDPNCPCYKLDQQSGILKSGYMSPELHKREKTQGEYQSPHGIYGTYNNQYLMETFGDMGGASRFFYQAKASNDEKWFYCKVCKKAFQSDYVEQHMHENKTDCMIWHPTQKPEDLMIYLIRLVTPPNEIVLDPFCGTGTTAMAAERLGFKWITCDKDPIYIAIAQARIDKETEQGRLF